MSSAVARIGAGLNVGTRSAWLIVATGLIGVTALVAVATRQGMLSLFVGGAVAGLTLLIGLRWPLVPLLVFAALIPIEEVVVFDGLGTISRLAGVLFAVSYAGSQHGRLNLRVLPLAAWAYLAWALASLVWAIDQESAWSQLVTLLQLFLIAALVADFVVKRPEIVRPVLWVYSASAAATSFVGIRAYFATGLGDTRAAALEGQNPAQFAAVLLPALVFGLYQLLNGERVVLGGALVVLTSAGVLVSGTRGAWVAVVVVVALVILPQLSPRRQLLAVVTVVALGFALYQLPGIADLLADRTENAISSGGAGRTDIWSVGATIYQSAPVFGVGYDNFPVAYTPEVVQATNVSTLVKAGRAPHNILISTLVELGPLGLTLLALFLGPLVVRRGWGRDAATVQAALASLLTLALFLDILSNRKQVWLVIGLAAGLTYLARRYGAQATVEDRDRDVTDPVSIDARRLDVVGRAVPPP
jgi:O-antigen ligase